MSDSVDRYRNPFDIDPPSDPPFDADPAAVFGFGDPDADIHVVGDHPGIHGGRDPTPSEGDADGIADERRVPFSHRSCDRLRSVLQESELLDGCSPGAAPRNLFLSYVHPVVPPAGRDPTAAEYAAVERFFDAEFRAVNAHIVVPVGNRAFEQVLHEYTARANRIDADTGAHHATEIKGRGRLIVPVREPGDWTSRDEEALQTRLTDLLASDYRQTADLGRFIAGREPYEVH